MANKEETIKTLKMIITELSANSFQHRIQSKIFNSQGFTKLGEKYAEHATEELDFVEQFMDRILDLGGTLVQQQQPEKPVYEDVLEFIKADYQVSVDGINTITELIQSPPPFNSSTANCFGSGPTEQIVPSSSMVRSLQY